MSDICKNCDDLECKNGVVVSIAGESIRVKPVCERIYNINICCDVVKEQRSDCEETLLKIIK